MSARGKAKRPGRRARPRVALRASLKLNAWEILSRSIEASLRLGWNRAHKHTDKPDVETILERQFDAVMGDLSEIARFDQ
jgi:hypothetical protein